MTTKNLVKPVENWQDIEKQIEIEAMNLEYYGHLDRKEAFSQAREYIHTKFASVVEKLKSKQ